MGLESATSIAELVATNPTSDDPISQADDHLRLLKSVLKTCFGGVDGPVLNADDELATAADFHALFEFVAAAGSANAAASFVGDIRPFYGDTENIPSGWYLCDGSNGTPDLRGRMLIGGNESPAEGLPLYEGQTLGGNLPGQMTTGAAGGHTHSLSIGDHNLTVANLPAHDHKMFVNAEGLSTGNDANKPGADDPVAYTGPNDRDYKVVRQASGSSEATIGVTADTGSGSAVTHSGSTSSAGNHTHTLDGASLPPWHAVHYIMYTGE